MVIIGLLGFLSGIMMIVFIGKQPINAAPIMGGILCALGGYVLMRLQTDNEIWNSGRIVPAQVSREGEMAGMEDAALGIAGRAVGLGSIGAATGGAARPTTLQYVAGGRLRHAQVASMLGAGNIVWIVLYQGAHTLPECAPDPFDAEVPPADVQAWLRDALENTRELPQQRPATGSNMAEQPPW